MISLYIYSMYMIYIYILYTYFQHVLKMPSGPQPLPHPLGEDLSWKPLNSLRAQQSLPEAGENGRHGREWWKELVGSGMALSSYHMLSLGSTPTRRMLTTRIMISLVRGSLQTFIYATVTGWGVDPSYHKKNTDRKYTPIRDEHADMPVFRPQHHLKIQAMKVHLTHLSQLLQHRFDHQHHSLQQLCCKHFGKGSVLFPTCPHIPKFLKMSSTW